MYVRQLIGCVAIFCAAASASGATIVVNNNFQWELSPDPVGRWNYVGTIWQDPPASDYTSAWFLYDGSTIRCVTRHLDEGSDYYVVHEGDAFGPETVAAGSFTPLTTPGPVFFPPVPVIAGEDFYLGVSTAAWPTPYPQRTVYGWVCLHAGPDLSMAANVVSYDSPGIIVGTTVLLPEPTFCAMLATLIPLRGRTPRRM